MGTYLFIGPSILPSRVSALPSSTLGTSSETAMTIALGLLGLIINIIGLFIAFVTLRTMRIHPGELSFPSQKVSHESSLH